MLRAVALLLLLLPLGSRPAQAQALVSELGALLTEQRPTSAVFVPDTAAAVATATTVTGLFAVEFSTLPILGRRLSELSLVQDVYEPHPSIPGVETMRWLPAQRGVHTMFLVTGAKWNVARSGLLNTNLLIRVTDAGLRARVTPAVSLDYAFEH